MGYDFGSALSGAGRGASTGAQYGGAWGAAGGALTGLVFGGIGGAAAKKRKEQDQKAMAEYKDKLASQTLGRRRAVLSQLFAHYNLDPAEYGFGAPLDPAHQATAQQDLWTIPRAPELSKPGFWEGLSNALMVGPGEDKPGSDGAGAGLNAYMSRRPAQHQLTPNRGFGSGQYSDPSQAEPAPNYFSEDGSGGVGGFNDTQFNPSAIPGLGSLDDIDISLGSGGGNTDPYDINAGYGDGF